MLSTNDQSMLQRVQLIAAALAEHHNGDDTTDYEPSDFWGAAKAVAAEITLWDALATPKEIDVRLRQIAQARP